MRPKPKSTSPAQQKKTPNPASASIPPSIPMKINDRFSPNPGTLQKSRTASPMRRLPLPSTATIPSTARRPALPSRRTQPSESEPWHSQPGCGRPAPANRRRPNRRIALPLCEHQNPNPASASIPPSISMKINDRFSPNPALCRNRAPLLLCAAFRFHPPKRSLPPRDARRYLRAERTFPK